MANTLDLGRVRLVHKGAYNASTAYEFFDCATYNGSSYVCTADAGSPAGTLPTDTSKWALLAQKGDTGAKGATGAKGVSFVVKGAWASGTAYVNNTTQIDVVTYNGSSYACKTSHTASSSILPTNTTYWTLIAQKGATGAKGDKGATGATGPKGDKGEPGATPTLSSAVNSTSTTVAANSAAVKTAYDLATTARNDANRQPHRRRTRQCQDAISTSLTIVIEPTKPQLMDIF